MRQGVFHSLVCFWLMTVCLILIVQSEYQLRIPMSPKYENASRCVSLLGLFLVDDGLSDFDCAV